MRNLNAHDGNAGLGYKDLLIALAVGGGWVDAA
jgi:hypothetical protein